MPLERRKNQRIAQNPDLQPKATIHMNKPFFQEPFDVEIHDISNGGLKIHSPEAIPLFYELDLDVNFPKQRALRYKGKAVYKIQSENGFNIGINFVDLD